MKILEKIFSQRHLVLCFNRVNKNNNVIKVNKFDEAESIKDSDISKCSVDNSAEQDIWLLSFHLQYNAFRTKRNICKAEKQSERTI